MHINLKVMTVTYRKHHRIRAFLDLGKTPLIFGITENSKFLINNNNNNFNNNNNKKKKKK